MRPNLPCLKAGAAAAAADDDDDEEEEEEDVVGWWGTADEAKDALDGAVGKARACWRRSTGERASSSPSELTAVNGIPAGT